MNWLLLTAACIEFSRTLAYPEGGMACEEWGYHGRAFKTKDTAVDWLKRHAVPNAIGEFHALLVDVRHEKIIHVIQTDRMKKVTKVEDVVDGYDVELKP